MRFFRIFLVVPLLLAVVACSTHPRKVDCEAHLVPINPPAPASSAKTASEPQR